MVGVKDYVEPIDWGDVRLSGLQDIVTVCKAFSSLRLLIMLCMLSWLARE
jgi:hypothetical protein